MAEIKSTMDMAMERAARIVSSSKEAPSSSEETIKQGMRRAACFLEGSPADLAQELANITPADQPAQKTGMATTLLRNILLPREEKQQHNAEKAMQGLMQLGQNDPNIVSVLQEISTILGQFQQHKEQLRAQLKDSFSQQMEQMEANLARETGASMKLSPEQHPKFQEEWIRLRTELDNQYGHALEQNKNLLKQRFVA